MFGFSFYCLQCASLMRMLSVFFSVFDECEVPPVGWNMNCSVFGRFQWIRVDANILKTMTRRTEGKRSFSPVWTEPEELFLSHCHQTQTAERTLQSCLPHIIVPTFSNTFHAAFLNCFILYIVYISFYIGGILWRAQEESHRSGNMFPYCAYDN